MASYTSLLDESKFHNWLKSALAVLFAKEGIEEFVHDEMVFLQRDLLQHIYTNYPVPVGTVCSECTTENVLYCKTHNFCTPGNTRCKLHDQTDPLKTPQKCRKQLCHHLRDGLKSFHRNEKPSWKITDARRWCMDPFQLAKCFLPPDGYKDVSSLKDTDFNGVVSIIINCRRFQLKFENDLSLETNVCSEARKVGRNVRHSSDLSVTETTLQENIDILLALLSDTAYLAANRNAKAAIEKINQLKMDILVIASTRIQNVIEDVIREHRNTSPTEIDKAKLKALNEIKAESLVRCMTIKDVCGRFQEKMSTCYIQINRINTTTFNQFINITHVGTSDSPRGIEHKDERLRKDLQEDLVTFYEDEYKAIPVSPLVPGHDANILDFYVKPNMQIAQWNIAGRFTRGSPKSQVISYKDVFMNGSSKCHDIYVTAKAGNGKTTFAKRLCMIWCCTKGGSKISYSRYIIIEENDLAMLQTFSFLFFIPLREVRGNECDLDDIIYSQVIDRLSRSQLYDRSFLKTILHEETSLVILEGLDEWFHPESSVCTNVSSIPHRKPREKCTFLSTTRVSKMYQAGIKNSRVDKYIKMTELGEESVKQLIHNVVLSMTGTDKEVESAEKFIQQLRHILSELAATPIILIQLLCLWRDGRTTGKTICDIYLNIIELMLQLREERHGKMCFSTARNQTEQSKPPPSSLKKYEYCRKYYQLLVSIGCISFKGTFSGVHSPSLVYESSIVQSILSEKEIRCCLQMGILTEKTAKGFSKKVSNYSFNHKTYQEFFTALYVQAYSSTECVLAFCQNLETILSMKSVLVFLSGLNSELFSLLSHQLSNAMSDFCFLRSFRRIDALMNSDLSENHHLLKLYQDMNISCVRECELEGKTVYLDDFFLDEHIKNKEYCCTLRTLIKMNRQRIKSLTITDLSANMLRESVDMFQLNRMDTLVKIFIRCEIDEKDLDILLKSSVKTLKCIRIVSSIWKGSCSTRRHIPLSEIACNAIENMPELVSLVMEYLILTHSQLENLVTWVERKITLEQFGLSGIKCKDHGETCPGVALDMSGHSHIESLVLDLSPVSNIKVNLAALQECSVGECYAECVLFDMLKNLEKANKLRAVQYFHLTPPKVIEQALNTLQKLTGLVSLELHEIDLGQTDLKLPESMKNIRCIRLDDMKLSETVLQNLLTRIKMFQQPVRIDMWNCQITPEDSFLMLKDSIHSSDEFRVLNEWSTTVDSLFSFETKKYEDDD